MNTSKTSQTLLLFAVVRVPRYPVVLFSLQPAVAGHIFLFSPVCTPVYEIINSLGHINVACSQCRHACVVSWMNRLCVRQPRAFDHGHMRRPNVLQFVLLCVLAPTTDHMWAGSTVVSRSCSSDGSVDQLLRHSVRNRTRVCKAVDILIFVWYRRKKRHVYLSALRVFINVTSAVCQAIQWRHHLCTSV